MEKDLLAKSDTDDTSDVFVARQPIFNRKKSLYAYELLFRDGLNNMMPNLDGDTATSTLLSNSFLTFGIDALTGGKKAFINFTRNLLIQEIPFLFPRETTVIEILENIDPEESVIKSCQRLSKKGYLLALDDFVFQSGVDAFIELADIIKVDFRQIDIEKIREYLNRPVFNGTQLLAEKVETEEEFKSAIDLGFEYFQGYFFCKPEIIQGREIANSQINLLKIVAVMNQSDFKFEEIEKLINQDLSISYKLLRYINAAFFKRVNRIENIRQALVYLGEAEIRRFVSLLALSKIASGKPNELIKTCCIRARFCELLGTISDCTESDDALFTVGLFSSIDAILSKPMEEIVELLPFTESTSKALVSQTGELGRYLKLIESYEKGDWESVKEIAAVLCMLEDKIPSLYLNACQWANMLPA